MRSIVRIILYSILLTYICYPLGAYAVSLSLNSTNEYVYVTDIKFPIEGRGMGPTKEYCILRGEDISFINEAIIEFSQLRDASQFQYSREIYRQNGMQIVPISNLYKNFIAYPLVNDITGLYLHSTNFFSIDLPPPIDPVEYTNIVSGAELINLIYPSTNETWDIEKTIVKNERESIPSGGLGRYYTVPNADRVADLYNIINRLQRLYVHCFDDYPSRSYIKNGISSSESTERNPQGDYYKEGNNYTFSYVSNDDEIVDVSWTNATYKHTYIYDDSDFIKYNRDEIKSYATHIWNKHTSDRVDSSIDAYGKENVITTKLYTTQLSIGGIQNYKSYDTGKCLYNNTACFSKSLNNVYFITNNTPLEVSGSLESFDAMVIISASISIYETQVNNTNSNSTESVNRRIYKYYNFPLSKPITFKFLTNPSLYNNKAYIPLTDSDISSFANIIINDIDNTYFKFTKNPPTPSINVTPDIEQSYPLEGVTYEWEQKPINISLRVSANCNISGLIFSYKPRYRVTWK